MFATPAAPWISKLHTTSLILSPLHFHAGSEPWHTWTPHLVVGSVVARFVDVLVVGVLAFGLSSSSGLVSVFVLGVGFVFVFAVFVVAFRVAAVNMVTAANVVVLPLT
jgi:hypothetical protein